MLVTQLRKVVGTAGVALLLGVSTAGAQTVVNGDFNTAGAGDPDYFGTWVEYIAPVGPPDCQVNGNSRVMSNTDGAGDLSLVIRAQPPAGCISGVSQTITGLTVGNSYSFDFFARYVTTNDGASGLSVIFGGQTLFDQFIAAGATFNPYATSSYVATSTSALLQIEGFTELSAGQVRVDDIVINSSVVPEPSSIALFGAGFAGLLIAARRRRRQ